MFPRSMASTTRHLLATPTRPVVVARRRKACARRNSNEGGLLRNQTSPYARIDIFFLVHGNGDYGWSAVDQFGTILAMQFLTAFHRQGKEMDAECAP